MLTGLAIFMATAVAGYGLGWPVCRYLVKWNTIDHPNERSSHERPTVRGGGLAIMAVILSGLVGLSLFYPWEILPWISVSALIVAAISFVDDIKTLPSWMRFGCHAAIAVVAIRVCGGLLITLEISPAWSLEISAILAGPLLFFWLAGYTNAFNFMDGINGIAAGQAVMTGWGMALIGGLASGEWTSLPAFCCLVVAGASAGFLPHNFPKARMFMGDVGSAPLGYLLAALVIWTSKQHGWWLLIPLGLLHANFVLDTGITLTRRVLRGERWYDAHREHFYQRLVRSGKSHVWVTASEMTLQGIVLLLMLAYIRCDVVWLRFTLVGVVMGIWLGFFAYCELAFRRTMHQEARQ